MHLILLYLPSNGLRLKTGGIEGTFFYGEKETPRETWGQICMVLVKDLLSLCTGREKRVFR